MSGGAVLRRAGTQDAALVARLLYDFNIEFGDPTPEPDELARRVTALLEGGDTIVLLAGEDAGAVHGFVLLRFRRSLWSEGLECYLAELYVVPERRRRGLGMAIMVAAMEAARSEGATFIELGTSEDDTGARALYERLGFTNRERPGGPVMYVYEREL